MSIEVSRIVGRATRHGFVLVLAFCLVLAACNSGDDGGGGGGTGNSAPVLAAPDASAGDTRVVGVGSSYGGNIHLGDSLALSFQADAPVKHHVKHTVRI